MSEKRIAAFWAKVEKTDGCWIWTGKRHPKGYGLLSFAGKQSRAHRIAWELTFGEIPHGLFVCHRCDNPTCGGPGGNAKRKLTAERVIDARRRHPAESYATLARECGVSFEAMRDAVRGFTWADLNHLEPPGTGGPGGGTGTS